MQDTSKYPHFIPDNPSGVDCFEGHSQERLAHNVCNYVRMIDDNPELSRQDEATMPRIIGLEGTWGSGKSNVVRMIESELREDNYYTFTYDSWGHQEDLQRRSILETMTSRLIDDEVLEGTVKIQMRNGKVNKDTWRNQLSLLLSNKTTTIRKSMPKLSGAAVCGICLAAAFAVLTVVSGLLLEYSFRFPVWGAILMDLLPIILGVILAFCYRIKDGNWDRTRKLISQREDDTIDEEYTSSEEPSVAEFKNWMRAISDFIGSGKARYKRLIIVFDNMDRLPSEKVMQLWSSIYSFFAGGEFERIWAIIPYDYIHLCQAIYGNEDSSNKMNEDVERIKQFINKTFPITYHVPTPVITDYKKLFSNYFDEAFGPNVHDKEHICQVFMHLEEHPNPRTVIRFVNELVAMNLQWSEAKYRLQNQALFILKKDFLLYDKAHLDAQLLNDELFDKIGAFYPDKEKVRTELCQYAYGLEDEKLAGELPLRNELNRLVKAGESIADYVDSPNFLTVLEDVLNDTDQASLDNVVRSMASLDCPESHDEEKERLQSKWDFLANMKTESHYESHTYNETLTILIGHATHSRVVDLAMAYANAMQHIPVIDGVAYFNAQKELQDALKKAKVDFDDTGWYQKVECDVETFFEYVCEAKEEYAHYNLVADVKGLNKYLYEGAISGDTRVASVIDYIINDKRYDLTDLTNELADAITNDSLHQEICVAAYVNRRLSTEEGMVQVRVKPITVTNYLQRSKALWSDKLPVGLEDVMSMYFADGKDLSEIDDRMLPRISECMDKYFVYTDLLKHTGNVGSAFRKLNIYCIENQKGGDLDTKYVARHLVEIKQALGLESEILLHQFNRWPIVDWGEINPENEYVKDVKNYVHQSFFKAYLDCPGFFSDSMIRLGAETLRLQQKGFLAKVGTVYPSMTDLIIDQYWKSFVITYLDTDYLKDAGGLLTIEAITILQWLIDRNVDKDPELLAVLLGYVDNSVLKPYLHKIMNEHFVKTDIDRKRFLWFGKLLPILGADMDANTARGLVSHFIKPVYKDAECAVIIIDNIEFYVGIMQKDIDIALPIINEMVSLEVYVDKKKMLEAMLPKGE